MKYLIKRTNWFVDPHGTPDEAGEKKYISDNSRYALLETNKLYYRHVEEIMDYETDEEFKEELVGAEAEDARAEDGYNCEVHSFKVTEISDEEADRIEKIIYEYESI